MLLLYLHFIFIVVYIIVIIIILKLNALSVLGTGIYVKKRKSGNVSIHYY